MTGERIVCYTWQDIENYLYCKKNVWPEKWVEIEVFSKELVIYANSIDDNLKKATDTFFTNYMAEYYSDGRIQIPITDTELSITFEKSVRNKEATSPFPLFRDFSYVNGENSVELHELPGAPVIAFHSYKGGVGRTLSIIAYVRSIIEKYGTTKKVLIVDGDMEAPGLTWLGREQYGDYEFSYIDLLNIISAKGINDVVYERLGHILEGSYLKFHDDKLSIEQFFLPTYRNDAQLLDIYSKPERIMIGEKNKYVIADAVSIIGKLLKADAVLVDLRAGISEYSAPFLFDPRVIKYVVTSTSDQSIIGTDLLLSQLRKQKNNTIENIILTMVNNKTLSKKDKEHIYQRLLRDNSVDNDEDVSKDIAKIDTIVEIEKQDSLIHLGSLNEICDVLNGMSAVNEIYGTLVKNIFPDKEVIEQFSNRQIEAFRRSLNDIARENVTAEGNDKVNLLITKSVMQLRSFTRELPKINILGAKGSGKTYLYKQMLAAKTWNAFLSVIEKEDYSGYETMICPVLSSEDRSNFIPLIDDCLRTCKEAIPKLKIDDNILSVNESTIRTAVEAELNVNQWIDEWENVIWNMFEGVDNWKTFNSYLQSINKRIIFIFDGLENLLYTDSAKNILDKNAVKAICKGLINRLLEKRLDNIGVIVFVRKDIAESAIDINFEQFRGQYQKYELNWEQEDALKLAWKLMDNAAKQQNIILTDDNTPIYNLTGNVIEQNLNKVWGKKMGPDDSKTAGSNRWVRASLSDFNGQLQARDIVRFLKYATTGNKEGKRKYNDRLISPDMMKAAVQEASKEKLDEVEKEIQPLQKSFKILKEVSNNKKQVPLRQDVLDMLQSEDMKLLERHGYLKEADGEYYIPESVRYALGYNKTKRGGIKLVSLLSNKNN